MANEQTPPVSMDSIICSVNNTEFDSSGDALWGYREIETMLTEWSAIQCAEKDKETVRLQELIAMKYEDEIKIRELLATKEEAIKELVEGLLNNDETLSYLEDFTHGYEGHKITQQRAENQPLIQKHKV